MRCPAYIAQVRSADYRVRIMAIRSAVHRFVRDLFRTLFPRERVGGRGPLQVVRCGGHAEAKAATRQGGIVALVGDPPAIKWAYLLCPCGCKELLPLNLMRSHSPRWELRVGANQAPTLDPSVISGTCGSHFWVRNGEVIWLEQYSTSSQGTDPRHRVPKVMNQNTGSPRGN